MLKLLLLLFSGLKFGKIFMTGGTMLISVVVYAWIFGWRYAVGFVALLFVHEMGHFIAARQRGLPVGAHLGRGGVPGRHGTAQPHKGKVLCRSRSGGVHPRAGIEWQRLTAPLVDERQSLRLVHTSTHQGGFAGGNRQHLQRHFGN